MKEQILLNAFSMNCVGHINHGLWTHPRDLSFRYKQLDYWTDLARTLERGLFDGLFIADILGVYDVYGRSVDLTLRESIQLPVNDPLMLVSAMAATTSHLGFGVTVNIAAEPPYLLARRLSTLDHLTDGRIGWNIVTGYLDSAARAMGQQTLVEHDARYDQAEDLEVLYKLWETSWDDDAVIMDRTGRIYAQPGKVRTISHRGKYYQMEGYHLAEPSRQRTPVLFQAGTSPRGRAFAGRHAECTFISAPDPAAARAASRAIRQAAVAAGRQPDDIKVFVGITVVADKTKKAAKEKYADYCRYASPEAGLAHFSAGSGIDLAAHGLDTPIGGTGNGNSIQSNVQIARERGWTKRSLLDSLAIGGRYPTIVGDGAAVADALASWITDGEVDGFNLTRTVVPESYEDFVDIVVPALQDRGLYKTGYAEGSFRSRIFGNGDRLQSSHPAGKLR